MLKSYIRKFILGVSLIVASATSFSMSIGPIYFNQRIDGAGGFEEYTIDNETYNTTRYKIQVKPVTSDAKLQKEMEKWVEVYPKVLTIPPKSSGKVKVLIKSAPNTKPGEYKFSISPTPLTIPTLENKKSDSKLAAVGIKAPLHFSMGLSAYVGNLGDIHKDLKIEKIKSKDGIKFEVDNKLKREVALEILVTSKKTRYRDVLKVKAGGKITKAYPEATKLEITEASTKIELKNLY
ncbi:hypothetical protein [Cetobacterium somerae]|uniref:hypothetical protein n=1 Tax=Cetobacterium somerae TaxID=188913 RepID=UPI0038912DA9